MPTLQDERDDLPGRQKALAAKLEHGLRLAGQALKSRGIDTALTNQKLASEFASFTPTLHLPPKLSIDLHGRNPNGTKKVKPRPPPRPVTPPARTLGEKLERGLKPPPSGSPERRIPPPGPFFGPDPNDTPVEINLAALTGRTWSHLALKLKFQMNHEESLQKTREWLGKVGAKMKKSVNVQETEPLEELQLEASSVNEGPISPTTELEAVTLDNADDEDRDVHYSFIPADSDLAPFGMTEKDRRQLGGRKAEGVRVEDSFNF
ncbi:hypothetical protein CEUSTIGMA_g12758.t1 [Chlamydomonas eustigma]|uniref:Uncharacterized protein n=1 Tax=Chlamydomonas eustigma TaxID=1157962 RepID=A0A250XQI9_9CHLO|nr:hypothetical protein CEUSTIGMA_g12758.t1 [Chlamydomonas eustigma]|eukprot:GAX85341.1 hypothetical protein CEUSTIGMA_g12758.t1 [Chlamydomonas eustigma]